jgi:hypothetical protein
VTLVSNTDTIDTHFLGSILGENVLLSNTSFIQDQLDFPLYQIGFYALLLFLIQEQIVVFLDLLFDIFRILAQVTTAYLSPLFHAFIALLHAIFLTT